MSPDQIISISLWMIIPLGILGSLLHFSYEWSGHNRFVAMFSAVNESYWEHIKIAIWPIFLLQMWLFIAGGYQVPAFVPAATVALYSIPISMIAIVFGYKAIARKNILFLDISAFFISVATAQILFVQVLRELEPGTLTTAISSIFMLVLLFSFSIFTHKPPAEPDLFLDPTNDTYGTTGHTK